METERNGNNAREILALNYDLGTFEGFNFRHQGAIYPNHSAEEVVNWDHDKEGEAEFWPSGDAPGVSLVFNSHTAVTSSQIVALDNLLVALGDDSTENYLRIYFAVNVSGYDLATVTGSEIEDQNVTLFMGTSFLDLRKEAAYELFELYYPEAYAIWEKTLCDGLIFDPDIFLDSPGWSVDEVTLGDVNALIVASN